MFRNGLRLPNDRFEKKLRPENDIRPVEPVPRVMSPRPELLFAISFLAVSSQYRLQNDHGSLNFLLIVHNGGAIFKGRGCVDKPRLLFIV